MHVYDHCITLSSGCSFTYQLGTSINDFAIPFKGAKK